MLADERQDKIYEIIQNKGAVEVGKLVKMFDVSNETIRRDLLLMEQEKRLTRVHGGAVAKISYKPFKELTERNKEFGEEKRKLVSKAIEFINEGDVIGVDSGSTSISFAEAIKEKFSRLTVVTHSLDVFEILHSHKEISVILCGGHYMSNEKAFYGNLTLAMLKNLQLQKVFICPSGISFTHGIFDYSNDLCQIQKQLLKMAENVYILAVSSLFETTALFKLDEMKTEYTYITDNYLDTEIKRHYRDNDIKIYLGE